MKIALLTDGIQPYVIGGMQRHSFFIAKYLAKNKIYVDLYHCWQNKEADINKLDVFTEEEKKYIRPFVIVFPENDTVPSLFSPLLLKGRTEFGIKLPGHYLRRSYRYSERIFEVLKNNLEGVDFIYSKGFSGWKLLEEKSKGNFPGTGAMTRNIPVGIKFHGLNMFQKPPSFRGWLEQFMFRGPVKFNIRHADYVFSYGGKITGITRKIGVPAKKIIEIPTGIESEWLRDEKQLPSRKNKRSFLFVGRYERLKGIQELSETIRTLQKPQKNGSVPFEFHFIGPVPFHLQVKDQKVNENGIEIFYHGQISDSQEIKKIMDSSDVLVIPSYSEGMPNVIIEAMARGMAVIATDVGAVNCLVNSENGFLLSECSVKKIQDALISAVKLSDEKLTRMKKISLQKIKQEFLWENVAVKLVEKIKQVIS